MMIQALIENIFLVQVTIFIAGQILLTLTGLDLNLEYEFKYIYMFILSYYSLVSDEKK